MRALFLYFTLIFLTLSYDSKAFNICAPQNVSPTDGKQICTATCNKVKSTYKQWMFTQDTSERDRCIDETSGKNWNGSICQCDGCTKVKVTYTTKLPAPLYDVSALYTPCGGIPSKAVHKFSAQGDTISVERNTSLQIQQYEAITNDIDTTVAPTQVNINITCDCPGPYRCMTCKIVD